MKHIQNTHRRSRRGPDILMWVVITVLFAVFIANIPSLGDSLAFSGQKNTPLITELMPSNSGTITNGDGEYCDWIELYNPTDQPINLAGFTITDDPGTPAQYVLPYWVLDPGAYVVAYADDQPSTDTELHVPFKLKNKGEILFLFDSKGTEVQRINFPGMDSNDSFSLSTDTGEWEPTDRCTPGFPNTDDGYAIYQQSRIAVSPVAINEVMPGNTITLRDEDGDYSDWVELYNSSTEPIDLTGWGLSDTETMPKQWEFPSTQIQPGEYLVIFLSGKNKAGTSAQLHTDFKLNTYEDTVLLSNQRGQIVSKVDIRDVKEDLSYALIPSTGQWKLYSQPTPGYPNTTEGWNALQKNLYSGLDSPIIISEVMSNNATTLQDQYGEYPDWIELYNCSENDVDLSGWGLTDDTGALGRWQFPPVILPPGEYLTVYASGRDTILPKKKHIPILV